MTDERLKNAMRSACNQLSYMCSLPQTENTPREQRVKDEMDRLSKLKYGKDYGKNRHRLDAEWEYLKTMDTIEGLEAIVAKRRTFDATDTN